MGCYHFYQLFVIFDRKRTRLILRRLLVIIGLNHLEEKEGASNFNILFL